MTLAITRLASLALAGALLAGASGCATLSEGECYTADWYQLGRADGQRGYERSRLYEHRKACAEYGIRPDATAYYRGRQVGLAAYCTPRNGYEEGRAGHVYRGVCPPKYESRFLAAFRDGQSVHEVEEDIEDVERDIDRNERIVDDEDSGKEERRDARRDLRHLHDRLRILNHELRSLERTMTRYRY
ncbi:MAG: DUF2799 domain-containing protein [Pseudomonadota bacterium]